MTADPSVRIGALLMALHAHRIPAELVHHDTGDRLRITLTTDQDLHVWCAVRAEDAERLWFFGILLGGVVRPLGEAHDITTTLQAIKHLRAAATGR